MRARVAVEKCVKIYAAIKSIILYTFYIGRPIV